jgi:hypothetical protein
MVICVGNDATLEQHSIESLARHFTNPKRTLERLITYISAEISDVSALSCHAVVLKLRDNLRPDVETCAQYLLGDGVQPTAGRGRLRALMTSWRRLPDLQTASFDTHVGYLP